MSESTQEYTGEERREHKLDWHQTKSISLTIIILLLTNIVSTVWWAATITGDVESIKMRPDLLERVIKLEAVQEVHATYMSSLTNTLNTVTLTVNRIDKEQVRRSTAIKRVEQKFNIKE